MKIVLASDELYPVHNLLNWWLENHEKEVTLMGALKSGKCELSWVDLTVEAVKLVTQGKCDEGILCCWTGTGVSIVANRFREIRAALCVDAETARGARIWNHANVLCLSNRLMTETLVCSILSAWFEEYDIKRGLLEVSNMKNL